MGAHRPCLNGSERAQRAKNFNPSLIQGEITELGWTRPPVSTVMNQDKVRDPPSPFLYHYPLFLFYCMYTVSIYVIQFIQVMSVACMQPENWSACARVDKWLPPYIQDLHTFITVPPYQNEKNGVQIRRQYERLQRNLHADT